MKGVQIVSFGGGTDSTAMCIAMIARGERIDHIIFSDTGGEMPETYAHVAAFSEWLAHHGEPRIETIRRAPAKVGDGFATTLEEECLMRGQLPGIAYGFKSCSDKWKIQPFKTWLKASGLTNVTVCIGYDADETRRTEQAEKHIESYKRRYPLQEFGMDREACIRTIRNAGVAQPGKSSCFFCPSSRKPEILERHRSHPELMARAIAMEKGADLTNMAGLGRRFAWSDLIAANESQQKFFPDIQTDMPCGCHEGASS